MRILQFRERFAHLFGDHGPFQGPFPQLFQEQLAARTGLDIELAFVEKRVAANPNDIGMQVLLADYLSGKGTDLDRAAASANKAIQILSTATKPAGMTEAQWEKQSNGQKGLAYSALGQVYVNQKDDAKAVAAFEQAKPLLKDSTLNYARNLYRLGFTLAQMKRDTEARAALEEAAKPDTSYRAMAEELLRKKGHSQLAKRAGRETAHGRIACHIDAGTGRAALVEMYKRKNREVLGSAGRYGQEI